VSYGIDFYSSEFGGSYRPVSRLKRLYYWFLHTFYPAEVKNETRWFNRALDRIYHFAGEYVSPALGTKRVLSNFSTYGQPDMRTWSTRWVARRTVPGYHNRSARKAQARQKDQMLSRMLRDAQTILQEDKT